MKKSELKELVKELCEELEYLEKLDANAEKSFSESDLKDDITAKYPYMYGYVSRGVENSARLMKISLETLKLKAGWKE